jgi:hypothetical protein
MANEKLSGVNEAGKESPKDDRESVLAEKKREVVAAAQDTAGIDATPLGSGRKMPNEAPKPGEVDISGNRLLRGTNQNVLNIAKRNMTSRAEYGDLDEITVDNTQFILSKNEQGIPVIRVNVYGESSRALINQSIAIEEKDQRGALAYLNPPVAKGEETFIDQALSRLA